MQAWPFLISANSHMEYRPVVVPDFVQSAGATHEIARAAAGFTVKPGQAITMVADHAKTGPMSMVFRIIEASGHHIGLSDNAPLFDNQHRRIRLVQGVVLKGANVPDPFAESFLNSAESLLKEDFTRFWHARNWVASPSTAFELAKSEGPALELITKTKPMHASRVSPLTPATSSAARVIEPESPRALSAAMSAKPLVAGSIVATIVVGAYLLHRHRAKDRQSDGFAERIHRQRVESPQIPAFNR